MLSLDEYSDKLSSEILAKGGFELSAMAKEVKNAKLLTKILIDLTVSPI